jgi:hypothetical protein
MVLLTNGTICEIVNYEYLENLFHLPLSHQAFLELNQFEELCNQTVLKINDGGVDSWSYIWGSSEFSVKKAYAVMSGHQHAPPPLNSPGFGKPLVRQSTSFSFGFYFMID